MYLASLGLTAAQAGVLLTFRLECDPRFRSDSADTAYARKSYCINTRLDVLPTPLNFLVSSQVTLARQTQGSWLRLKEYDISLSRSILALGSPQASSGWIYVYQQEDADRYELISRMKIRPGSGTSLFVPDLDRLYVASQAIGAQAAAILVFEPVK